MKLANAMEYLTSAFHVTAAPENKRLHITFAGLHFTLQYGDNQAPYEGLSLEALRERLIWVDYRLAVLEEVDPRQESPRDRAALYDEMEELEEQFLELADRIEAEEAQSARIFSPKQLRLCC